MQIHEVALVLGIALLLAKLGEEIFRRKGIPSFIAPILVGLFIGPLGLSLIGNEDLPFIVLFTTLGIDFLLFLSGVEELTELTIARRKVGRVSILLIVMYLTIFLAIYIMMSFIEINFMEVLLISIIMGIISLGPLVKALSESGLMLTEYGRELLLIAALSEIVSILIFNSIVRKDSLTILLTTSLSIIGFYVFGKYLFVPILRFVEKYISAKEAPFAIIVALVLLTGRFAELMGFNAAIVALGLGIFSSSYLLNRPDILDRLKAFTYGFFEPLFFVGLGLYVSFISIFEVILGLVLMLSTSLIKITSLRFLTKIKDFKILSLSLAKGGIDAALLLIAYQSRIISSSLYTMILVSITLMAVTFSLPVRRFIIQALQRELRGRTIISLVRENIFTYADALLIDVIDFIKNKNGIVVVNKYMKPIGYVSLRELLYVNPSRLNKVKVYEVMKFYVPILHKDEPIRPEIIELICRNPLIAIVNDEGKLVGVLYPVDVSKELFKIRTLKRK